MATKTLSSPAPRSKCLVAAARDRMNRAGEDDDAGFNEAMTDIEILPATSVAGVEAKFDSLCQFLDTLEDLSAGASYVSWETINALRAGIKAGLLHVQHH